MDPRKSIVYKLKRKPETNEWMVAAYIDGKFNEDKTYYTDDKQDAIDTMKLLQRRGIDEQQMSTRPKFRDIMIKKESPLMKIGEETPDYSNRGTNGWDSHPDNNLNDPDHPMHGQHPEQCANCYEFRGDNEVGSEAMMDLDPGDAEVGPQPNIGTYWVCDLCTSFKARHGRLPEVHTHDGHTEVEGRPSDLVSQETCEYCGSNPGEGATPGCRGCDSSHPNYGEQVEDFATVSESFISGIDNFEEGYWYEMVNPRYEYRGTNKNKKIIALPPRFVTGNLFESKEGRFVRLENKINDQLLTQYGMRRVENNS